MLDDLDWTLRRTQLDAAVDADQVEKRAIELGTANMEEGVRDQRIADATDDFAAGSGEPWSQQHARIEDGADLRQNLH